jgi:ubiquinone biosynthesis O-methyltransferase
MKSKQSQERFFDRNPGLYPWPNLLINKGFNKNYKPRDVKFKKYLGLLEMKRGDRVLDVGCGTGVFLARIAQTWGIDAVGVDISKNSIALAKSLKLNSGMTSRLRFQTAEATKLPFKDKSFDHVLSFDVLEHVRDQKEALSEMVRVLKPSGSLLIYTINKHQRYTWNFWLDKLGIDIYERVAHDPDLFLDPRWVKKELERRNINIEQLELFNSFFTLAADEVIMIVLSVFKRLGLFESSPRFKVVLGRLFLNIANIYSRLSLVFLELLETPWKRFGYSNSFFVLGRKVK